MTRKLLLASPLVVLALWLSLTTSAQRKPAGANVAANTAAAANALLATLDDAGRRKLVLDYNDPAQRNRWSNLPAGMFQRAGLRLGDLTPPQRDAAMNVLKAALSPQGYEKIVQIVESDEALKQAGGAGRPAFGRDEFFLSFCGQPSATEPWIIQFGGHHLGLNVTLAGEHGSLAPTHTGAQPARFEFEGKTVRPLGRETDKAHALLTSLDENQKKQAILGFQMRDLVLGPGRDGPMIQPEGVKGSALTDQQRAMLLDLAGEWTNILHDAAAKPKMDEMKATVNDTYFAWSGPVEKGGAAYFRIHGPAAFIEYAPQRLGGDPTNHIHTIYRDPTSAYGQKVGQP